MSSIILSTTINDITLTSQCNQVITLSPSSGICVLSIAGSQGVPGPAGGESWNDYAVNKVQYTGIDTVIASGLVKECLSGAMTIYRFINATNNARGYPLEDSFYSDFDGTNLTNLIVTRGL